MINFKGVQMSSTKLLVSFIQYFLFMSTFWLLAIRCRWHSKHTTTFGTEFFSDSRSGCLEWPANHWKSEISFCQDVLKEDRESCNAKPRFSKASSRDTVTSFWKAFFLKFRLVFKYLHQLKYYESIKILLKWASVTTLTTKLLSGTQPRH